MPAPYVPEAGDIVWLTFDPLADHKQAGLRPALVLSPATYNRKTGLMLCCPLTTQIKGYPFEVIINQKPASAALADQCKSLDWRIRKAKCKGHASVAELREVRLKLQSLLGDDLE
jgi:mRNA interferase MazF